jgi:chemotaxis protein histidine kinase CheA
MSVSDSRSTEVFDRLHLHRYSMENQELAAEVVGLFLVQLPAMLHAIDAAASPAEWAFATHTLKGSSAALGAQKLSKFAAELETMDFPGDLNLRLLRLQALKAAALQFREMARQAYPQQD